MFSLRRFLGSHACCRLNYIPLIYVAAFLARMRAVLIRIILFRRADPRLAGVIAAVAEARPEDAMTILAELPAERFSHPPPGTICRQPHWKFIRKVYENPPIRLFRFRQPQITGREGYLVTAAGALFWEVSRVFTLPPHLHPVFSRLVRCEREILDGNTAVLAQIGQDSYFHWLFEILPKFKLLADAGAAFDRLLVSVRHPFQRDTLGLAGFGGFPCITPADERIYCCEQALAISKTRTVSAWRCDYLREIFAPVTAGVRPAGRRIYISRNRTGRRRVRNETEVLALLARYGFELVDPEALSVFDQARLFAGVDWIVAPHGGALSNIVFCRPGATLVELHAPGYVNCCYWEIASLVGLRYWHLLGRGRSYGNWDPLLVYADIRVDLSELERLLQEAGIGNS